MSGKVKITQEQADAIESHRNAFETLVRKHRGENIQFSTKGLSVNEVIRAYFDGYEVEPEINDGDFLLHIPMNVIGKVINGVVYWSDNIENDVEYINKLMASGEVRHAIPEEIAKEKERRWWADNGREPWELKQGDVLIKLCSSFYFEALEVENVDDEYITLDDYRQINYKTTDMKINYKVVCFAEDRKDVDYD